MILFKWKKNETPFIQLKKGDTFMYDGLCYIKTPFICYDDLNINALCLNDTTYEWIDDNSMVEKINLYAEVKRNDS